MMRIRIRKSKFDDNERAKNWQSAPIASGQIST